MKDLLKDYLAGVETAQDFFQHSYLKASDRIAMANRIAAKPLHPVVLQELIIQNPEQNSKIAENIAKLKKGNACVVVTGQQLGVCGGPLFTFYKISSTIATALALEKETKISCIPLFWLQSEDHDFEEIRSTAFLGRDGQIESFKIADRDEKYRDSCGEIVITAADASEIKNKITEIFGERAKSEIVSALTSAYSEGKTLSQAISELVRTFFGAHGLLVLDPHRRSLKQYAKELIASSIVRTHGVERVLEDRGKWMESKGYSVQVPIKSGATLFFLSHRPQGSRQRIRPIETKSGEWSLGSETISKEALLQILDQEPERFTSSALIRPILQDHLLPTVAYVCGPTEFNYWVQLKPLYEFFGVTQPLIVPRAHIAVLSQKQKDQMERHGLTFADLERNPSEIVLERSKNSSHDPDKIFSAIESQVLAVLRKESDQILPTDPQSLQNALETTAGAISHNLEKFKSRYVKALTAKEQNLVAAHERLRRIVFPQNTPQERVISFCQFCLTEGLDFVDQVIALCDPLETNKLRILTLA